MAMPDPFIIFARIVNIVSGLTAGLLFGSGLWGHLHQHELYQPGLLHGANWITIPCARFMVELTRGGNPALLAAISTIIMVAGAIVATLLVRRLKKRAARSAQNN